MPETTENYHRIPVSSGHSSHELRTISIDSDRGIKALYCTDCKEVVTYLFDTDKWTMDEAKEWVESHKGLEMSTKFDRRTKDVIGSSVRYKSYGTLKAKTASADDDSMLVRGFFTSDEIDEVGDIITRAATEEAVERWRKWGNIRTMHDYPSGRVDKIGKADGLEWNELVTVPVDQGTRELIAGGVLKAYSVGIIPREYELNEDALSEDGDDDPFFYPLIIHSYDMVEISYVDHPANYSAATSDVSTGKAMGGGERAVLFKNLDITGDGSDMNKDADMETDVAEVEDVEDADVEEEGTEDVEEPTEDVDADEPGAESKDIDEDDSDNEADEGDEPSEGVLQAVQDVGQRLDRLEGQFSQVADKIDGFVDEVVGAFMDALTESGKFIASSEAVDSADDGEANTEKSIDVDALTEQISEGVLKGLVEALTPEVARSAHVTVDDSEEEADGEVDKTAKYLGMTPDQRRSKMKDVLKGITSK